MKHFVAAIFLLMSTASAFGGEWHSAGNAPVLPHRPGGVASYTCRLTGYTEVGKKSYRFEIERIIEDREFREPHSGVVFVKLENTGDPGMDGQSMSLSFLAGQDGHEILSLNVGAVIADQARSFSRFTAARSEKSVTGVADLYIAKAKAGAVRSVRVRAVCTDRD